jgi:DNA modification methylase
LVWQGHGAGGETQYQGRALQVARVRRTSTIASDYHPERILGAFNDVYRVLKPGTFCVSFYGWNRVDAFLAPWRRAGFVPVGHLVWQKNYASRRGFLEARHEQAYRRICSAARRSPHSR